MRIAATICITVVAACSANDDLPAPQIASITPAHAVPGAIVVVAGNYFCHQPETEDPLACRNVGAVAFGQVTATTSQYTDTSVMAEVPDRPGMVDVTLTVAGHI